MFNPDPKPGGTMFTEKEKNRAIAIVVEQKVERRDGRAGCPFDILTFDCMRMNIAPCKKIFPKLNFRDDCPCGIYPIKYVKSKFWKAME